LPDDLDSHLTLQAEEQYQNKGDLVRKALVLYQLHHKAKAANEKLIRESKSQSGQRNRTGKTRQVVILQNQTILDVWHPSTIILPLTSQLIDDAAPLRLRISTRDRLQSDSDILVDQTRAIDNLRLVDSPPTSLTAEEIDLLQKYVGQVSGT